MKGFGVATILRLSILVLGTLVMLPGHLLTLRLAPRYARILPRRFHRLVCFCLGVRTRVSGTPPAAGGLIVANHVSWLDISVIGAQRPVSFVAKSEVADWPVIGWLSTLQHTVFIDRQRRGATAGVAAEMGARLSEGEAVVLFAEGTTGDGTRILPMRSSLLGAAHHALASDGQADIAIYPLAITYTGFHGIAGGRFARALLAWYGETELAPHLKALMAIGAVDVELVWGPPVAMGRAVSRKEATRLAESAIRQARREAVSGRALA